MKLIIPIFLNIFLTVIFYSLEKYTSFKKLNYWTRQILIGVLFGSVAMLASHFGMQVENTVANVRDASPLLAGLVFGSPAAVISGFIGGIYRWFSVYWGTGTSTRLACSVATILAGLVGALLRKLMFDNKKPSPIYGAGIIAVMEIIHMLLIFFTNMSDTVMAFGFVRGATIPMITGNVLTVFVSLFIVKIMGKKKREKGKEHLAQTFQRWLLICIIIAFVLTGTFTYHMQSNMSTIKAENEIKTVIEDVHNNIVYESNRNLLEIAREVAEDYNENPSNSKDNLLDLAKTHKVDEINIIDDNGFVISSTDDEIVGFDMKSGKQSSEFMALTDGETELVQLYQQVSRTDVSRKYAGIALENGFIQVGYAPEKFQQSLHEIVMDATKNRHIGENGFIAICDGDLNLVIDTEYSSLPLSEIGIDIDAEKMQINTIYEADVFGILEGETGKISHMYAYDYAEGYVVVGAIPTEDAMFMRNVSVYVSLFMEVIIFAALFLLIYFLIKKIIINNLNKINSSLSKITDGNLDVTVDVRSNQEFASLSDDINSTVDTLKRYIDEAATRIDKELEYAKTIQLSALPSKFPPYPEQTDFDIYAQMIAAKEVGGDFYDFYMPDDETVAFLCADVSGKGIPAAMFMMQAKTIIKELAERGLPVNEVFTLANQKLCEGNDSGMFVTAWMGILNLRNGLLQYANAGHNPPLILRENGDFQYLRSRAGFVLGGMEDIKYRMNEIQLSSGDRIFLYTDGITEATDTKNELYGEDRLINFMNKNKHIISKDLMLELKNDIDIFVGEASQSDDITMLMFDYKQGKGGNGMSEKSFIAENSFLPEVLNFVEEELDKAECPSKVKMQIMVAIEEIFVNIARYAYGDEKGQAKIQIGFDQSSRTITFILSDKGVPFNPLQKNDPDITLSAEERQVGGLGIFITKKTMDNLSYRYENGENILTMQKNI